MSADNGYLLRKNKHGEFVLQEYCASADEPPSIDSAPENMRFKDVEAAVLAYGELEAREGMMIEYGLSVQIDTVTEK